MEIVVRVHVHVHVRVNVKNCTVFFFLDFTDV